jgi:SAM-dependent methyltransferase
MDIWCLGRPTGTPIAKIAMDESDLEDPAVRRGIDRVRARVSEERRGARVLIEKVAINNFRLAFLHRAFPEALFINIERDGAAVAASIARKIEAGEWHGASNIKWRLLLELAERRGGEIAAEARRCGTPTEQGMLEWKLSVQAANEFCAHHPEAPLAKIRYESLLADPAGEIGRLLSFLGVEEESIGRRETIAWSAAHIKAQPRPVIHTEAGSRRGAPERRSAPVFIAGVPRSGTTLLRVLLDSHSAIACGPETPWLCAHGGPSVQGLVEHMARDPLGYCRSFGMGEAALLEGARAMVTSLLESYARARGKRRWAEKTPGHGPRLPFLRSLFPDALFIVIERNGVAVSASTSMVDERRRGISEAHERWLDLARDPGDPGDPGAPEAEAGSKPGLVLVPSTPFAAALRWRYWSMLIDRALEGARVHRVSYEALVREPERVLRGVCDFLDEAYEPAMLEYGAHPHDLPEWEWGSADVRVGRIDVSRLNRPLGIAEPELSLVRSMTSPAEPDLAPVARIGSVDQLNSARYRLFMSRLNDLARSLGLQEHNEWSKIWEYPFLWLEGLSRVDLRATRVVDVGSERSPMPWLMAMLGARVTLVETSNAHEELWSRLRRTLGVDVSWSFVDDARLPLASESADVVTSFSVVEHQVDRRRAIDEAARVLRRGGLLAISFDVCEPRLGMTFPEWNGRAMTLDAFEREVWRHSAFFTSEAPSWNREDIAPFLDWHRGTAEHHNYIVGAAVLRRSAT